MSKMSGAFSTVNPVSNFNGGAQNMYPTNDLKTYLCPKCNQNFDLLLRNHMYVGRVPLILKCTHTMCEDCIRTSINNRVVLCGECQQPSTLEENDRKKLQNIFPVNFYLMGLIYYSKPNLREVTRLNLKPAGVSYKEMRSENRKAVCHDLPMEAPRHIMIQEKCSQMNCRSSTAVLRCTDCDEVYCEACCRAIHQAARGLMKHKIVSLSTSFMPEILHKCLIHPDNVLEFTCNTCDVAVCCYCLLQNHQGHDYYQLTYLSDTDRPEFESLIKNAEEKLKRLLLAHKQIRQQLTNQHHFNQPASLEVSIGRCFSNLHARLQNLEKKLRSDAMQARNINSKTLNELSYELISNIHTLSNLIEAAKNLNHQTQVKLNVKTIIERLENALSLPCFFIAEQQNLENIEFVCRDLFSNLEDNFTINVDSSGEGYRLVTEDKVPEGFDKTIPAELSLEECAELTRATTPTDISSAASCTGSLKSMTKSEILANALQPQPLQNLPSGSTVDVSVQNTTSANCSIKFPELRKEDRENVIVTHINTPECFYVQLLRFNTQLHTLSRDIFLYIRNFAPVVKTVELNKLYIVKYETKNMRAQWHRGRLIDIVLNEQGEELYNIFFIDYGNTRVVNLHMLREINSFLVKPRPHALQCKIFNVYPVKEQWDSKAMVLMAQIITGRDVIMIVMNNCEGILEVDLAMICKGYTTSMRAALIFIGHAMTHLDTTTPEPDVKFRAAKPLPKLNTRTENFKTDQALEVVLTYVVSPYKIYVQVADYVHHIEHLGEVMARYYSNKSTKGQPQNMTKEDNIYVPKKGMVVAVRCLKCNPLWYRGIVTQTIDGQGLVEVFLVDYGKLVTTAYTHIRRLSERFHHLDCQAILVKMADLRPHDNEENWGDDAKEFLNKYVNNKDKLRMVIVQPEKPPTVALFECYASLYVCVNAFMVNEGYARGSGKMSEKVEWLKHAITPPIPKVKDEPSFVSDLINVIQCAKKTNLKLDEESDEDQTELNVVRKPIRVLLVKNPDLLYVASDEPKVKLDQDKLDTSLQEYYSTQHVEAKAWEINDLCVVFDHTKKKYFRAIIQKVLNDNYFAVMLKDIAEEKVVLGEDIYILENKFKQYREGCFRCHLSDIVPAGDKGEWSALSVDFLQDIFLEHTQTFLTKSGPVDKRRKSLPVIMWYYERKPGEALEPSRFIFHNINKMLIRNGLGLKNRQGATDSELSTAMEMKEGDTSSELTEDHHSPVLRKKTLTHRASPKAASRFSPTTSRMLPREKIKLKKPKTEPEEPASTPSHNDTSLKHRKSLNDLKNARSKYEPSCEKPRFKRLNPKATTSSNTSDVASFQDDSPLSSDSSLDDAAVSRNLYQRPKSTDIGDGGTIREKREKTSLSVDSSPLRSAGTVDVGAAELIHHHVAQPVEVEREVDDWNDLIDQEDDAPVSDVEDEPRGDVSASDALPKPNGISEWLPPLPFDSTIFEAYATNVDHSAHIYVHDAKLEPVFHGMEKQMKTVFDSLEPEPVGTIWYPDQLCTVKYFITKSWFRGRVVSVNGDKIKVQMIDFGNEEDCNHEDLRFKVMYADVPAFANKISLHGVFAKGAKWLSSDLDLLHKEIVEHKILVELKGNYRPGVAVPAVVTMDGYNINQLMLDNCSNLVATRQETKAEISEPDSDDVIIEEEHMEGEEEHMEGEEEAVILPEIPLLSPHASTVATENFAFYTTHYTHNTLPKPLKTQTIPCNIISFLNYNRLVFEISTDTTIEDTRELFESMSEDIRKAGAQQPVLYDLNVGQACISQFSEDGEWYRAEVISLANAQNGMVDVWYVDFGNFESVSRATVRAVQSDWLKLPVLQYMGEISDIELVDKSDLPAVMESLAQHCSTSKLVEVLSIAPLRVRLYDENKQLTYQNLIDQNLLVLKESKQST